MVVLNHNLLRFASIQIARCGTKTGYSDGLLGSIAVSGIADGKEQYEQIAKDSPGQYVFLAYAVQTLYPRFQVNEGLTEKALSRYRQIENACAVTSTDSEIPTNQMLKPNWEDNGFVHQFFARNTVGPDRKSAQGSAHFERQQDWFARL
jgi:hypothetical protein